MRRATAQQVGRCTTQEGLPIINVFDRVGGVIRLSSTDLDGPRVDYDEVAR